MALNNESILNQWGEMIAHGAGRGKWILDTVENMIDEANMPGIVTKQEAVSSGMFGSKRDFLTVAHTNLSDIRMYIGARDFGIHLDVAWYLTAESRFLKRALSKYTMGNPHALARQIGFYSQQDIRAFVGVAHQYVKETCETVMRELGQNPAGMNTSSKGFLELW